MSANTFDARATLAVGERSYEIFRLDALQASFDVAMSSARPTPTPWSELTRTRR
jgi:hypothetical protein